MIADTPPVRLLLVEDDPISRAYLAHALEALPAIVDQAADVAAALALASPGRHQVWLLDANLPDGSGASLLARLRAQDPGVPALCHTAGDDAASLAAVAGQGFDGLIRKPVAPAALREAVRRHLPAAPLRVADQPLRWDDESATRALNGERAHVDALRKLFLDELPATRNRIRGAIAGGSVVEAETELHKLRASCGFVGAPRLDAAVRALQQEIGSPDALRSFEAAVDELLDP
ncbi:response regulator [Novilysobacter defluvii]|nr:response regulator [Lysobacter defluvii]